MKIISSKYIYISKKIFPFFWFGFLAFFIVAGITGGAVKESLLFLIVPVILAAFGYFVMKKLVWDLMDEVIDHGEFLTLKYQGQEDVVYLQNVMNVSVSIKQNPPRVTLKLRSPGKFGSEVAFSPASKFSFNIFKKNGMIEDLIMRVDKARR